MLEYAGFRPNLAYLHHLIMTPRPERIPLNYYVGLSRPEETSVSGRQTDGTER